MNGQELNKKLAGWAGFQPSSDPDMPWTMWSLWGEPNPKTLIRPLIGRGQLGKGLNFTQSLDACFKWLVPKLEGWMLYTGEGGIEAIVSKDAINYTATAETPALALCLAIEKLISEEK